MRAFLDMRDHDPALAKAREKGTVGIPFIVKDDGTKTLRWKDTVRELGGVIEEVSGQACSVRWEGMLSIPFYVVYGALQRDLW